MELPSEYSFQFKNDKNEICTFRTNRLQIEIHDDTVMNVVSVKLKGFSEPLVLWSGLEYAQIGDYTQKQVEERILELLGPDIKRGLWNLSYKFLPYEDEPIKHSTPDISPDAHLLPLPTIRVP